MEKLSIIGLSMLFASCSCSREKENEIVKDQHGKYYRLTNERVMGNERYRLIEVDTSILKKF